MHSSKYGPRTCNYGEFSGCNYFGEFSAVSGKPHGRGVLIKEDEILMIQYFEEGCTSVNGRWIFIKPAEGWLQVGIKTCENGSDIARSIMYKANETIEKVLWMDGDFVQQSNS